MKLKKVQCIINIKKMHMHMHYMDVYKKKKKKKNSKFVLYKNAVLFGLVFTVRCCVFICLHDDKYIRCVITSLLLYVKMYYLDYILLVFKESESENFFIVYYYNKMMII